MHYEASKIGNCYNIYVRAHTQLSRLCNSLFHSVYSRVFFFLYYFTSYCRAAALLYPPYDAIKQMSSNHEKTLLRWCTLCPMLFQSTHTHTYTQSCDIFFIFTPFYLDIVCLFWEWIKREKHVLYGVCGVSLKIWIIYFNLFIFPTLVSEHNNWIIFWNVTIFFQKSFNKYEYQIN